MKPRHPQELDQPSTPATRITAFFIVNCSSIWCSIESNRFKIYLDRLCQYHWPNSEPTRYIVHWNPSNGRYVIGYQTIYIFNSQMPFSIWQIICHKWPLIKWWPLLLRILLTQWLSQIWVITAVPKLRAGFMLAPVYLIVPKCPTVTAKPIANGPTYFESSKFQE